MKSDRPLLVTESVTIVVPGYFLQQQWLKDAKYTAENSKKDTRCVSWGRCACIYQQMKYCPSTPQEQCMQCLLGIAVQTAVSMVKLD